MHRKPDCKPASSRAPTRRSDTLAASTRRATTIGWVRHGCQGTNRNFGKQSPGVASIPTGANAGRHLTSSVTSELKVFWPGSLFGGLNSSRFGRQLLEREKRG